MLLGFDILLLLGVLAEKLFWCPFTKIEESFNVEATHDFLFHTLQFSQFDHKDYPGVVPRTFLGSALLSIITVIWEYGVAIVGSDFGMGKEHMSVEEEMAHKWRRFLTIRLIIGCLSLLGYLKVRQSIKRCFGPLHANVFIIAVALQFHLIFYSTRLLANTFGLVLTSLALASFLEWQFHPTKKENNQEAIWCFVYLFMATFIFRCDILLLFAPLCCFFVYASLFRGSYSAPSFVSVLTSRPFIFSFLIFLISVIFDSILWYDSEYSKQFQLATESFINRYSRNPIRLPSWFQPMWPEFYVFFFNTVENKSHLWGVSPWHWYITSALPRTLGLFLLGLVGIIRERRSLLPGTIFWSLPIIALSFLGHKEARFIFPSILGLTAFSSIGLVELLPYEKKRSEKSKRSNSKWETFAGRCLWCFVFFIICSIAAATSMARFFASVYNYPGGWAVRHFNNGGDVYPCLSSSKPIGYKWEPKNHQLMLSHQTVLHPTISVPLLHGILTTDISTIVPSFVNVNIPLNKANTKHYVTTTTARPRCKMYIDAFSSETGVSRYLEYRQDTIIEGSTMLCEFNKSLTITSPDDFDFIVSENASIPNFHPLFATPQFKSYKVYRSDSLYGLPILKMEVQPKVYIYAKSLKSC